MKFEDFSRLYSQSKTLRFEAIPIGKTKDNIEKNGVLTRDQHRAESYVKMKKLIDEFYKSLIDQTLSNVKLGKTDNGEPDYLQKYFECSQNPTDADSRKELEETKQKLRTLIAEKLMPLQPDRKGSPFSPSEVVNRKMEEFVNGAGEEQLCDMDRQETMGVVSEFKSFATYFKGFFENRNNMFTNDGKATEIAFRLIDENLPKFVDNIRTYAAIGEIPEMQADIQLLYSEMAEYLNVESIDEMFRIDYYDMLLTQKQISVYNTIIGGRVENGRERKIKGINEYVNLYNQKHKEHRLPKLKMLFKQILSDREIISWIPEQFENDADVINAINCTYDQLGENVLNNNELKQMLCSLDSYSLDGIFITNDAQLTSLSQKMFGTWSTIENAIEQDKMSSMPQKRREDAEKYHERLTKEVKAAKSFSIEYLDRCLSAAGEGKSIESHFALLGQTEADTTNRDDVFSRIEKSYASFAAATAQLGDNPGGSKISQDKDLVGVIKELLDAVKDLQHFVKPLLGNGDETDKDELFYGELSRLWQELSLVTPLYNKVRNYLTQKPYSLEKIKLCFDNNTFLAGWDKNKEADNSAILLRRDGKYFLAVMDKKHKKMLRGQFPSDGECYEKIDYKQISLNPNLGGFVRKCTGTAEKLGWSCPQHLKNSEGKIIIKDDEAAGVLPELIECYKEFLDVYEHGGFRYKEYGFIFKPASEYTKLSQFFNDVAAQKYKIAFSHVSAAFIDRLVDEGKMYLFQIYNKDFSAHSHGTPNMHTLYWKALFDERNLADVVYQLNGGAELFFRKKSLDYTRPTHPAGQPIKNKNALNANKERTLHYDLTKDRRFTVDKFQFHVPITMNFKSNGREDINQLTRQYLHDAEDIRIIGIDRGERHLLYYSVIDLRGNILEQGTLNTFYNEYQGVTYSTDYHDLLSSRQDKRQEARKNWQTIENIKNLKEGYLSQVVHKITQLMLQHHAIVVLEDLNFGFMRGRQKVEKQVYQKFEKMLVDKLGYLVDKQLDADQPGGLMHAFQLASKFRSFQELHQKKQSGFLFYIPAWNTSKIDPVTGFVNLFDTRRKTREQARQFFSQFDSIRYNDSKEWFEFDFDYSRFTNKAEGTRTKWTLCTGGQRIITFRNAGKNNEWDNSTVDLTLQFTSLFRQYAIDIHGDLKAAILAQDSARFFEDLMKAFRLTLQMRNSIINSPTDYLVSPVANEEGRFYDSRTCADSLPGDADANGAYNIARKGLMMVRQIKQHGSNAKFDLSNKQWLNFAQLKPYLQDE